MACLDGQVLADRLSQRHARQVRVTSQGCVFVGSPVSKQSAHHSAYQSTLTTAVMVKPTPAATTGRTVFIGFVAILILARAAETSRPAPASRVGRQHAATPKSRHR
jgi:hypothetical protein